MVEADVLEMAGRRGADEREEIAGRTATIARRMVMMMRLGVSMNV